MLRCTESLYTAAELGGLKAELLQRGYVILPRVYQRHTVPAVRENKSHSLELSFNFLCSYLTGVSPSYSFVKQS